ncbi:MAG: heavy metal translocating P-type ATPase, partial [Hyphomicrobium sp.]|nr:heavy metal translocating P-type ATPase [Hyphomicrobium sp.]
MTSSPSTTASSPEVFRFRVDGMDCASCSGKIETAVRRILGVSGAKVSFATSTLTVEADPALVPAGKIESTVGALGFQPTEVARGGVAAGAGTESHAAGASSGDVPWWQTGKARITAAAGILVAVAYGLSLAMPAYGSWVFIAATAIAAFPIARRSLSAALAGSPFSIEMLMVIAAAGAVVIGAAEEAAVVVFLFLIGELLEGYAAGRARAGIRALADIVPKTALVEEGDAVREVDMATLAVGQRIRVRPGDRIAADGKIVAGSSSIDEAPITGESLPKSKSEGDAVFAGSINGDGVLSIVVEKTAADNTIARIIRLVEEAQEAKAPTERFIDRFSAWYTPAVVVIAVLVAAVPPLARGGLWADWIYRALALLLIACPCA